MQNKVSIKRGFFMHISRLSNIVLAADRIMDYIPFVGVVNNVVDIALKGLLYFIPEERKEKVRYFRHLDQKTVKESVLYAIPLVGTVAKVVQLVRSADPMKEFETKKQEREEKLADRRPKENAYKNTPETKDRKGRTAIEEDNIQAQRDAQDQQWIRTLYTAADQGVAEAMRMLAEELNGKNEPQEAIFWYKKAAAAEDLESINWLAQHYEQKQEFAAAAPYWILAAAQGDEDARHKLYMAYSKGKYRFDKDLPKALEYCVDDLDRWGLCIDIIKENSGCSTQEKCIAARYLYKGEEGIYAKREYGYKAAKFGDKTIPALTVFQYAQDKVSREQARAQKKKQPSTAGYLYAMMVDLGIGGAFEAMFNPKLFDHLKKTVVDSEVLSTLLTTYYDHSKKYSNDIVGMRARERLRSMLKDYSTAMRELATELENTDKEQAIFWYKQLMTKSDQDAIDRLARLI